MWLSFITFTVSLIALIVLFACKTLEGRGKMNTPLAELRRVGDPFIEEGLVHYAKRAHSTGQNLRDSALVWGKGAFRKAEAFSLSRAHALASRLHRHLMRRQRALHHDSQKVSAHLKGVGEERKGTNEPAVNSHEKESTIAVE